MTIIGRPCNKIGSRSLVNWLTLIFLDTFEIKKVFIYCNLFLNVKEEYFFVSRYETTIYEFLFFYVSHNCCRLKQALINSSKLIIKID